MQALAAALASRGAHVTVRPIADCDAEFAPDPHETLRRRRASGAARLAARESLAALGGPADGILARTPRGLPVWPDGFIGALAHSDEIAAAVAARSGRLRALGLDVEPAEALPDDVAGFALSAQERRSATDPAITRALFAGKEAVYKAVNAYDGTAPEFDDISIDFEANLARLRDGRTLRVLFARQPEWIVVAYGL